MAGAPADLLGAVPAPACALDAGGRVLAANAAFAEVAGTAGPGDALDELFVAVEGSLALADALAEVVRTGTPTESETIAVHGGRLVAWIVSAAPPGSAASLVAAGTDLTIRSAVEEELRIYLLAELEARLADLAASRARIVHAGDAERRRLERDLHDGVQQRLVAVAIALRGVEHALAPDQDALRGELDRAVGELERTVDDVRALARGLHPGILAQGGLCAALRSLGRRSPVPVDVDCALADGLPEAVEVAAYYVVSEALANVAKHAGAAEVHVSAATHDGALHVTVADDGRGGADPAGGSGLLGLRDRVAALDGALHVVSPPGGGTTVRAALPL
jgi:signal transduction histidine kinase